MQNKSLLMASVRELHDAYQEALRENSEDVDIFKRAYIERVVMLCDFIEHRAGVVRANSGEQEGD